MAKQNEKSTPSISKEKPVEIVTYRNCNGQKYDLMINGELVKVLPNATIDIPVDIFPEVHPQMLGSWFKVAPSKR